MRGFINQENSSLSYEDIASLSNEDRKLASEYVTVCKDAYKKLLVVLGVYRGSEAWDLRPVFLDPEAKNSLFLMRVVKPGIKPSDRIAALWHELPQLFPESYLCSRQDQITYKGENKIIYWGLRRFATQTLNQTLLPENKSELARRASDYLPRIVGQLAELETRMAPHGQINKSNLGILGDSISILDPWLHSLNQSTDTENLSARGFCSLFLNLFGSELDQNLILAFQKILSAETEDNSYLSLAKLLPKPHASQSLLKSNKTDSNSKITAPSGKIISPSSPLPKIDNTLQTEKLSNSEIKNKQDSKGLEVQIKSFFSSVFANRGSMFFVVALIACALVMFIAKGLKINSSNYDLMELQENWESNIPARERMVAQAALEQSDQTAREVIETDILAGNIRPGTNANFLKIAFNQLWREELSSKDETFAFALALAGLYRMPSEQLSELEDLHPGILLALLGDISLQSGSGKFDSIETKQLSELPGAYGSVFSQLNKLGILSFADESARAAARLITGASDQETFDSFIASNITAEETEARLRTIIPFCEMYPDLSKLILTSLASRSDIFADRVKWFIEDSIAQWNQVDQNSLVYITIGLIPESMDSFERNVDLLNYPIASVREKAKERVLSILNKPFLNQVLNLIIASPARLNRSQTLGLLAAMRVSADKISPFLSSWLSSNPDPQIVFQLLIDSKEQKGLENSFVELANYLARSEFEIQLKDFPQLLSHPEALARALAFPRLDPSKLVEKKILESWSNSESSPRLKEQIQAKLRAAAEQ